MEFLIVLLVLWALFDDDENKELDEFQKQAVEHGFGTFNSDKEFEWILKDEITSNEKEK